MIVRFASVETEAFFRDGRLSSGRARADRGRFWRGKFEMPPRSADARRALARCLGNRLEALQGEMAGPVQVYAGMMSGARCFMGIDPRP